MDGYTPTDWILWELNQPKIEWILLERQLNYWWRTQKQSQDTLQQSILKDEKSLFTTTIMEQVENLLVTSTEEDKLKKD